MLSPIPRRSDWVAALLNTSPIVSAFPRRAAGSACALSFSRIAQRSLALRPAHSRCHQFVALLAQRLQPLRYLHSCSGCFRLEHSPDGSLTHWKAPPLHGARPKATLDVAVSLPGSSHIRQAAYDPKAILVASLDARRFPFHKAMNEDKCHRPPHHKYEQ